jgi:proline iminopeptidase
MDPKILKQLQDIEIIMDFDIKIQWITFLLHGTCIENATQRPESINKCFKHINPNVYVYMQGHSEFGITEMQKIGIKELKP